MKTYKENLAAYIHVIEMCEKYNKEHGTDIKPWSCVKYRGEPILDGNPMFTGDADEYTFAISILEAKPVFIGHRIFLKSSQQHFIVNKAFVRNYDLTDDCCSWNPPKRGTVIINGVELPRPLKEPSTKEHNFTYECEAGHFHFNNYQEFQQWEEYFILLLIEAIDKED